MNNLISEQGVAQPFDFSAPIEFDKTPMRITVPAYLQKIYWWAYVHPNAVRVFEREWLVNLILFGNYSALRDAALDDIGVDAKGATLQVACAYGDLTPRLRERIADDGKLHVIDVLPIQLQNLKRKLPADMRVSLIQRDSAALGFADASYERVLVFFLLHEQPEDVRRRTLAEACRVVKPGGKVIVVDYHRPDNWNPVRHPLRALLKRLEPYADDLWNNEIQTYLPQDITFSDMKKETFFGGLYQKVVLTR
ncbi:MAG TPA: rhodoquinone biosynthesis methyltransferase RquA [Noviherbaspirillum sp.]|uniref:rhodoquinone biosynthesis methyltransferase RquA n=1 Tax=Noviherbaspirillum sp. TaxID=1926288 RepID=UPI002B48A779|nr:rhodoquinone biosynthesis methyltransferase RquA [Noviherbaspirillum sp.]HJV88636.1 rhodoquinone biosynthesis methyltransferase RquA [Noviherbaspirillum sp.]